MNLKDHFPRASKSFLDANPPPSPSKPKKTKPTGIGGGWEKYYEANHQRKIQDSEPQPTVCDEPVGTTEGKASHANRHIVSITSFRVRLTDPDNLCPKYFIDALRYAGAIPNDREEDIELQTRQEKVKTFSEERTTIEIYDFSGGIAITHDSQTRR